MSFVAATAPPLRARRLTNLHRCSLNGIDTPFTQTRSVLLSTSTSSSETRHGSTSFSIPSASAILPSTRPTLRPRAALPRRSRSRASPAPPPRGLSARAPPASPPRPTRASPPRPSPPAAPPSRTRRAASRSRASRRLGRAPPRIASGCGAARAPRSRVIAAASARVSRRHATRSFGPTRRAPRRRSSASAYCTLALAGHVAHHVAAPCMRCSCVETCVDCVRTEAPRLAEPLEERVAEHRAPPPVAVLVGGERSRVVGERARGEEAERRERGAHGRLEGAIGDLDAMGELEERVDARAAPPRARSGA